MLQLMVFDYLALLGCNNWGCRFCAFRCWMCPTFNGTWIERSDSHTWIYMELRMTDLLKRFADNESGATAIEYGLIAAGISVAIIAVVKNVGTTLNSTFTTVQTSLK
jgi:pilus assembly protein Flp/PilA